MGKCPHTAAPKGKRVRVKLKDGTVFEDIFEDRTRNKRVILRERGALSVSEIDSFGFARAKESTIGTKPRKQEEKLSIQEVRKKFRARLLAIKGVVGVGIKDNAICIYVLGTHNKLPESLEGYPVIIANAND